MKTVKISVSEQAGVFTVVSPKGGARIIAGAALLGGDDDTRALYDALAGQQQADLTLAQMTYLAAHGQEEQVRVRQLETITQTVMEPLMDGTFAERDVQKHAFQCLGCGLVWGIRWHAETCEERGHKSVWAQRYVTGPIVNGKPFAERFYERRAIRREGVAA